MNIHGPMSFESAIMLLKFDFFEWYPKNRVSIKKQKKSISKKHPLVGFFDKHTKVLFR